MQAYFGWQCIWCGYWSCSVNFIDSSLANYYNRASVGGLNILMEKDQKNLGRALGINITDTAFHAVSVENGAEIVEKQVMSFDEGSDFIEQLLSFVSSLKQKNGGVSRLGISVPGLVNHRTNRVEYSILFPEHSKVDIAAEIKANSGLDCLLMNDADAAASGEFKLGAGRGASDIFYATIGAGVGGSFILKGDIWQGVSGFAGEFGYMAINSDGMRLEDVASSRNIVRRTLNRFSQDGTSILSKYDESEITIADIVSAALQEDDFAKLMLERTGSYIGTAIASVINLLNIERIVIGGAVADAGDLILGPIIERSKELSFGLSFSNTTIVAGELGDKAAAIGAALYLSDK